MTIDLATAMSQLKDPDILHALPSTQKAALIDLMESLVTDQDGWPVKYVNRDTGRMYIPHTPEEALFTYEDGPWRYGALLGGEGSGKSTAGIVKNLERVRRKMSGLMACVAPETIIEGVPIAERSRPTPVQTLLGSLWASAGILEGKADLFRVATQSGESVTVTRTHRFLTPTGWRPLDDLRVGSLIAADDTQRALSCCERSPSSQGCCLQGSHPCGGLSTCGGQRSQGRERQPASSISCLVPCYGCLSRACIDNSPCRRFLSWGAKGYCSLLECGRSVSGIPCASQISQERELRLCSPGSFVHHPCSAHLDNVCPRGNDHALSALCEHSLLRSQQLGQSLSVPCPHRTTLKSLGLLYGLPYPNYTMKVRWVQITSITFSRYGEFYDLTVPFAGHYSAHGLFHHNSPDLPHFQRSLWKEFQRWCPWDCVIPAHRRMGNLEWVPVRPCDVVFENGSYIHCVGVKNAGSLEGPNLSWSHFDEARHYPDKTAITTLDGRIRVPGPLGEQPQMWYTTTPRMNWLFEFFGPVQCTCLDCNAEYKGEDGIEIQTGTPFVCPACGSNHLDIIDPLYSFKQDSYIVRLSTHVNVANLTEDFAQRRAQSLTESEAQVLIQGKWGDIEEGHPFLPNMIWWDSCKETLPPLNIYEPLVISLDAATGRQSASSDCFALVGMTRHPDPARVEDTVAVRFIYYWQARAGEKIDFTGTLDNPGPERVLLQLCGYELDAAGRAVYKSGAGFNVVCVVYDPNELHSMVQRLTREGIAWFREMGQTNQRYEADRQLLNLITHRRLAHGGEPELRRHIQNADRQLDSTGKKLRIVKRSKSLRIDLAVCTSMGAYQCLKLNL